MFHQRRLLFWLLKILLQSPEIWLQQPDDIHLSYQYPLQNFLHPKVVLKNPKTIGSLFKLKESVPTLMRSLGFTHTLAKDVPSLEIYLGSTKKDAECENRLS